MKIAVFVVLSMLAIISVEGLFINSMDDTARETDLLQEYRSVGESNLDSDMEGRKSWVIRSFYKVRYLI